MSEDQRKLINQLRTSYEYEKKKGADVLDIYRAFEELGYIDEYDADRSLLHIASYYADPVAVKYLLDQGIEAQVFDRYKATPLHYIADPYHIAVVPYKDIADVTQLLLEARVSPLRKNSSGKSPFHTAAERCNEPFLNQMVAHGTLLKMTNDEGQNVLHILATGAGQHQASRSYQRSSEDLEKHDGIAEKYFRITKMLVDYGVDYDVKDRNGRTPSEIASERDAKKVALVLSGEYDETDDTLDLKLKAGGKHLHSAVKSNDIEALEALIKLGSDVNEVYLEVPFRHQMPLSVACMVMNPDVIKMLLDAGADPNFRDGENERTALYWMVKYCYYNQDMFKEKRLDVALKYMMDAGLNLNAPADEHDNTCIACAYTYTPGSTSSFSYGTFQELFVRTVIRLGANVNIRNKHGRTALMEFVESLYYSRENELLDLLEAGSKLDAKDNISETVMMKAARNRSDSLVVQVAETLSDFGDLALDAVNNNGESAMDIALAHNNQELAKWILERM